MSVTQQLVDDVIAAGGSLRVPRKSWYARDVDYQKVHGDDPPSVSGDSSVWLGGMAGE